MKKNIVTENILFETNFIYKDVPVKDIKLTNPLFEKIQLNPSDLYINESKYFDFYELPLVTKDLQILTHIESYKAAVANNAEYLKVIIAKKLDNNDIPRLINFGFYIKKMTKADRYETCLYMREYLEKNKNGKAWGKQLNGDINQKLGTILGYDHETIKLWQRVGKKTLRESQIYNHSNPGFPRAVTENEEKEEDEQIREELKNKKDNYKLLQLKDFELIFQEETPAIFYKKINLHLRVRKELSKNGLVFSFRPTIGKGQIKIIVENLNQILTAALINEEESLVPLHNELANEDLINPADEDEFLRQNYIKHIKQEQEWQKMKKRIRRINNKKKL